MNKNKTTYLLLGLLTSGLIVGLVFSGLVLRNTSSNDLDGLDYSLNNISQITGELVKNNNPTPPQAALQYAYVSSVYADVYEISANERQAFRSAQVILSDIYKEAGDISEFVNIDQQVKLTTESQQVVDTYKDRIQNDGSGIVFEDGIPSGQGLWVQRTNAISPLSPLAGEWERWNLTSEFVVEDPITRQQPELYEQELIEVQKAIAKKGPTEINRINYWGGTPGTKTPSGIWLDTWNSIIGDQSISASKKIEDQKILTQAMSDSFMEAWKVKYTHWTERPSMLFEGLDLEMQDPDFPAYVSGHTTVSFTAATVLSSLYPEYADQFIVQAQHARDSRIDAGVHFPMDNIAGEKLGKEVGNSTLRKFGYPVIVYDEDLSIYDTHNTDKNDQNSGKGGDTNTNSDGVFRSAPEYSSGVLVAEYSKNSRTEDQNIDTGYLYEISSDDGLFEPLLVAGGEVRLQEGFKAELLDTDKYWSPAACASLPSTVVDDLIITFEGISIQGIVDSSESYLTVYDTTEKEFAYLGLNLSGLEGVNGIRRVDNNNVAIYFRALDEQFYADGIFERPAKEIGQNQFVERVINIRDFSFIDYVIETPDPFVKPIGQGGDLFLEKQVFGLNSTTTYFLSEKDGSYEQVSSSQLDQQYTLDSSEQFVLKDDEVFAELALRDNLLPAIFEDDENKLFVETLNDVANSNLLYIANDATVTTVFDNSYRTGVGTFGDAKQVADFEFVVFR